MKIILEILFLINIFMSEIFFGSLIILSFEKLVPTHWLQALLPHLRKFLVLSDILPFTLLLSFLGRSVLFPWAHAEDLKSAFQLKYFSDTFFILREAFILLILFVLARRFKKETQKSGAFPLVVLLFTGSLFATDWLMSLDPDWNSTAFGLIFLVSSLLTAYAATLLRLDKNSRLKLKDINTVHFAMIGAWTYLFFCQFLIVWSSNLPSEAAWYVRRSGGMWQNVFALFILCQFVLPMPLLLFKAVKISLKATKIFAFTTLFSQFLVLIWLLADLGRGL